MFSHTGFILKVPLNVRHTGSTGHPANLDVAFRVLVSHVSLGGFFANTAVLLVISYGCYT